MTYIELINAFNRWCENNYLPSSSQLLWFKLVDLFNKFGWCEWVTVDNQRLMVLMGIKREATFIAIRDKLIDLGFFEYQKGRKGYPNKYKICTYNFESTNSSINRSINSSKNSSTNRSHNKTKDKRLKTNEDNNKCCNNNYNAEIEKFNNNNILITPANYEKACYLIDEFSSDWITEAISRACNQNNRNLNYIEGILRSWKNKGFSTLTEIEKEYKPKESLEEKVLRVLGGGK